MHWSGHFDCASPTPTKCSDAKVNGIRCTARCYIDTWISRITSMWNVSSAWSIITYLWRFNPKTDFDSIVAFHRKIFEASIESKKQFWNFLIVKLEHLRFRLSATVDVGLDHIPEYFFRVDLLPVYMEKMVTVAHKRKWRCSSSTLSENFWIVFFFFLHSMLHLPLNLHLVTCGSDTSA